MVEKTQQLFADIDACFAAFDIDRDNRFSQIEFKSLCGALFRNDDIGASYELSSEQIEEIFQVFDRNSDGFIDRAEFELCWNHWIKVIIKPVSSLMVVDVQNDFITGTLSISDCPARHNGVEVVEPINKLIETIPFNEIFYSLDWHPVDHSSFLENVNSRPLHPSSPTAADQVTAGCKVVFDGNPPFDMTLWPRHCVENSWGAELHANLKMPPTANKICKAYKADVDSYSAFWDNRHEGQTDLDAQLKSRGVTDLYTCGIAYDYCVGSTAVHALEAGYRTIMIEDSTRGIDEEGIEKMREKIRSLGGIIVNSSDVQGMVLGDDRRPELGYFLAKELKKKV